MFFFNLRHLLRRLWHVESNQLLAATAAHFVLFWAALLLTEEGGAKLTEPVNYWYYWATTVLTIGYGDLSPASNAGRAIAPLFEFSGILLLAAWLTKAGMSLGDYTSKKRKGLMPTSSTGHVLILGDYDPIGTRQLLSNVIFDRKDDGHAPHIVGCFRNTGDSNPFSEGDKSFQGAALEYVQAVNGFCFRTLELAGAKQAAHIYVCCADDISAIGIIGALSRIQTKASVVAILRERTSADMVPETALTLSLILPIDSMLAVRAMEDPGADAALAELANVEEGESVYTLGVTAQMSFAAVQRSFVSHFGDKALLLGFVRKVESRWRPYLRPKAETQVGVGDRLIYIADQDFSNEDERQFNALMQSALMKAA